MTAGRWRKTSDQRPRVLLSEGSSSSARQTLYALGRGFRIGLADPSPLCQCRFSRLVRGFHRCPSYARQPAEYLSFLAKTVQSEGYDVLLPTHEQAYLLSRFRGALGERVGLALPDFEALKRVQSKSDFVRLLEGLGMRVPSTRIVRSLEEVDGSGEYPCYVKLPHSTAGHGVRLVRNAAEVRSVAAEFHRCGQLEGVTEIVVQQPAMGRPGLVQAVFQHGRLVGAHCTEALALGIGGAQMFRVSASHPGAVEDVRRLGQHLAWHGAMFIEYFYDRETGQAEYIEANPRIGETVNAMLCGVNLSRLLVRISLGETVEPIGPGSIGVRSHVGFLALMSVAFHGGNRRQLIAELLQLQARRGRYRGSHDEITRPWEDWPSLVPAAAVTLQLLLHPACARTIVRRAVDNYSLPESAAQLIESLPDDCLTETLR